MTIKEFRLAQGLSQPKLAKALGIGTSTVGGYESGRIKPSEKVIEKIKEVYGVDLNAPEEKPRKVAKKKAEKAPAPKAEKKPAAPKKAQAKKPAAPALVIQSPMGGSITPEEILARVGDVDSVYVRVDENKAYWVKGEASGSVDLW